METLSQYIWTSYPEPINVALIGNVAAAMLFFVVSFGMDNSSMFDQYWCMAPVGIAYYYAFNGESNWATGGTRKILVLAALTIWAIRLFALFFVKEERPNDPGGRLAYGKENEDARYKQFRQQTGVFYWPASLVSLHLIPALMLHWGCLPLYYALSTPNTASVNVFDFLAFFFTMAAITLEAVADHQLMEFMAKKAKDPTLTICKEGVWSWSRHPNYFGEFSFWLGIWFFGLAAAGFDAVWTVIGAICVLALFIFYSIPFMEARMTKHIDWKEYCSVTSVWIPIPNWSKRLKQE